MILFLNNNEPSFQPLYFKLWVEFEIFLINKKETLKFPLWLKIINKYKKNFISIKKFINNKYYVLGNVSFIT